MLDLKTCTRILNEDDEQYSEEEVKLITALCQEFAQMTLHLFTTLNNEEQSQNDYNNPENETSHH